MLRSIVVKGKKVRVSDHVKKKMGPQYIKWNQHKNVWLRVDDILKTDKGGFGKDEEALIYMTSDPSGEMEAEAYMISTTAYGHLLFLEVLDPQPGEYLHIKCSNSATRDGNEIYKLNVKLYAEDGETMIGECNNTDPESGGRYEDMGDHDDDADEEDYDEGDDDEEDYDEGDDADEDAEPEDGDYYQDEEGNWWQYDGESGEWIAYEEDDEVNIS